MQPGEQIDKQWEVENTGTCNWDESYSIRLVNGPEMGASKEQALNPARSQSRATIRILFTAPMEEGTLRSAWQAYSPNEQPFGDEIYIEVKVKASAPATKPSSEPSRQP